LDYPDTDKNTTEKMYNGVGYVFMSYLERFEKYNKENAETSKETINDLSKLSGSLGYMAQVHAGLAKAYDHEKRLAEIEKKLESNDSDKPTVWGK
jgi:hypothetical protein